MTTKASSIRTGGITVYRVVAEHAAYSPEYRTSMLITITPLDAKGCREAIAGIGNVVVRKHEKIGLVSREDGIEEIKVEDVSGGIRLARFNHDGKEHVVEFAELMAFAMRGEYGLKWTEIES